MLKNGLNYLNYLKIDISLLLFSRVNINKEIDNKKRTKIKIVKSTPSSECK